MSTRRTSTDYRQPYRPLAVRAYDEVARRVGLLRAGLDPEELLAAAARKEGLSEWGDPDPRDALAVLCRALEDEAALTPMGRIIQRQRLIGALRARLRVNAYHRAHPDASSVALEAPIVISALQRTGTTLLHRLLASTPELRALRSWEALNPAPFRGGWRGEDPRVAVARRAESAVRYLAPDFFAVHPLDASEPEEDVILLDQALLSTVPEATLRVPSYAAWHEAQDPAPAYAYLRRALQALSHQQGPGRWVLKTPHHMEFLDALFGAFPDARVVWTHRDPLVTIASFCSMVAHAWGLCSDAVDPHEVGAHWSRKIGRMVDRAMAVRAHAPENTFVDVRYDDLVADPVGTVRRVHDALDLPWTAEVEARVHAARERAPREKHGRHVYRLADFGLDQDALAERFAAYRARFGLDATR